MSGNPGAVRRIRKELELVRLTPAPGCAAGLDDDDDLFKWTAVIQGPDGTPYTCLHFSLTVNLSTDYPFRPPKIRFITNVYHPNVDDKGHICMDILTDDGWNPAWTINKILLSIISLLDDPNIDEPLNADSADMYKKYKADPTMFQAYRTKVEEWMCGSVDLSAPTGYYGFHNAVYVYTRPLRNNNLFFTSVVSAAQSSTGRNGFKTSTMPVTLYDNIDNLKLHKFDHWGIWVHDALFEVVRDRKTNQIKLGMQKYTDGYPPPGIYHRISTQPLERVGLLALKERAVACMAVKPKTYSLTTNNCQHFATSFLTTIMPSLDTTTIERMMFSLKLIPIKQVSIGQNKGRPLLTQAGEDAQPEEDRIAAVRPVP